MTPGSALTLTLRAVGEVMQAAHDPWWVIASAAVALHGVELNDVADVDVLLSIGDARRLFAALDITPHPQADHPQFRSDLFGTWMAAPLPVELMAGFRYRTAHGWQAVRPQTRVAVDVVGVSVFVLDRAELSALLYGFGRPKDHVRAARLAALA
ncbi:hypothetical protein QCD71_05375 [Sphingomonas sp. PsM26]|nr:hypothetical protein [Sphingomonas sp. PsM26]